MLCLKLTLLSPLSHWCRWPVSLPAPRAEDRAGRQEEEESVLETCHLDYRSSPEWGANIIWILPIKPHKRSHNVLHSEQRHDQTWLCNVLRVCFIDTAGGIVFSLPWGTFIKQIIFSLAWLTWCYFPGGCVIVSVCFSLLYYVPRDAMLIFHSSSSSQGRLAALFCRKKHEEKTEEDK